MNFEAKQLDGTQILTLGTDQKMRLMQRELIQLVFDAVNSPVSFVGIENRSLATVLVYCYATGTYCSEEIAAAASYDPVVRYLCANRFPEWQEVRECRRRNRQAIEEVLSTLFESVSLQYGPVSRESCRSEAALRLARAIQADSVALDF